MKCPRCNVTLLIADKQNVEIDYCPECRGIWLDRGELDKIIERSAIALQDERSYDRKDRYEHDDDHHKKDYDDDHKRGFGDDHNRSFGNQKGNKKRSFLSDLFDM